MASVVSSPVTEVPQSVAGKLTSLRRSVATWLWLSGTRQLLLWLVGLITADMLLDYFFRLDWAQRLVVLVLIVAGLGFVAYRWLVRPLSQPLDDDTLCLRVEDRHRNLGESLISAVQFSRGYEAERLGVSRQMVNATIDRGSSAARDVDFSAALDRDRLQQNAAIVTALAVILLVFAGTIVAGQPEASRIWFQRNVLLQDTEWPQTTYFKIMGVDDGVLRIPRGDDHVQIVEVTEDSEDFPELVFLDYQPRGWGSRITEQMVKTGDRTFRTEFKNVLEPFEFRVHDHSSYSRWVRVELIERPSVSDLQLKLTPPKYAGGKTEALAGDKGPYYVLKGSRLTVAGESSKPLADVRLQIGDKNYTPVSVEGKTFSADIPAGQLAAGAYTIELTDTDNWKSKRPSRFTLKTKADREPTVKARVEGNVSKMIIPGAKIPLVITLQDDFAVTEAYLVWTARSEGSDATETSGKIEFKDLHEHSKSGSAKIQFNYDLETGPLMLTPGLMFSFNVEALDNDDVSGPKTGKADETSIKVVTEDELRAELLRREKELRLEVERLEKDQQDLLTDTQALIAGIENKPELTEEQRSTVDRIRRKQSPLAERANSVATGLSTIIAEVRNNRLEDENGPIHGRLHEQIIVPLQQIGKQMVPRASQLIDAARRSLGRVPVRDQALSDLADQQQKIVTELKKILKVMAKGENFQEVVNLVYSILKLQNDLNDMTKKEYEARIRELFGPSDDKPSTKTPPGSEKPKPDAGSGAGTDKPAPEKPPEKPAGKPAAKADAPAPPS